MADKESNGFVPIPTKASKALKDKATESFKVTVFEPKKAALQKKRAVRPRPPPPPLVNVKPNSEDDEDDADIDDIFSDAPRKRQKPKEDPTVFDMWRARRDIMNFGFGGLEKASKHNAGVRLAIKLGAKAPKNPCRNYREMLEERKAAKRNDAEAVQENKGMAFGATQSFNMYHQRKQDKRRNPTSIMQHYGKANPRISKK